MKKLLAILVVFALFTSTVFAADVFFGAWGRADFVPLRVVVPPAGDSEMFAGTEVSWGAMTDWGVPAFGFDFTLDGGEIGFKGNIKITGDSVGGNEAAYTWWKPLDLFQLSIGWVRWEVLRGAGDAESFAGYAAGGGYGEDRIFNRFNTVGNVGAILQITPIENLYVGAAIRTGTYVPSSAGWSWQFEDDDGNPITPTAVKKSSGTDYIPYGKLEDVFKYSQYALGYDIPGIGLARFGYFGDDHQKLQIAFALKAVDGLFLDFGFSFITEEGYDGGKKNNIELGLVGNVDINDMISVWFGVSADLGQEKGGGIGFGLNPTFKLDFGDIGLGAYFTFGFAEKANSSYGFDLYIAKNVGGGEIKAGVAASIAVNGQTEKSSVIIAIPIQVTYSIY